MKTEEEMENMFIYQFTGKDGKKSIGHLTRKHHNSSIPIKRGEMSIEIKETNVEEFIQNSAATKTKIL